MLSVSPCGDRARDPSGSPAGPGGTTREGYSPSVPGRSVPTARGTIRAVLFDLGGTLVDERDYAGWCDLARRFYLEIDPDAMTHAYLEVEREVDESPLRGEKDEQLTDFWQRILGRAAGQEVSPEVAVRFRDALRASERPFGLFSDTRRCLDSLSAERRVLAVVSNSTSEAQVRQILHKVGILDYFSRVVSSGTEGVAKPDREIFLRALRRLKVRPEEALYVGNLPNTDAKGAIAAGLHALWLNRYGFGYGEDPPEITSLLEVPTWVRKIERGD